jgi:hypothetical protein
LKLEISCQTPGHWTLHEQGEEKPEEHEADDACSWHETQTLSQNREQDQKLVAIQQLELLYFGGLRDRLGLTVIGF